MLRRVLSTCLLAAAMVAANGCCSSRPLLSHRGVLADECGGEGCGGCDSCGVGREPLLLNRTRNLLTCGSGCGDVYWGEWTGDPPSCGSCGGCGRCGGCGECWPILGGLRSLWGYRYRSVGYGVADWEVGCESCGAGVPQGYELEPTEAVGEESIEKLKAPVPESEQPTPAKKTGSASYRMRQAAYSKSAAGAAGKPLRTKSDVVTRPVKRPPAPRPVLADD